MGGKACYLSSGIYKFPSAFTIQFSQVNISWYGIIISLTKSPPHIFSQKRTQLCTRCERGKTFCSSKVEEDTLKAYLFIYRFILSVLQHSVPTVCPMDVDTMWCSGYSGRLGSKGSGLNLYSATDTCWVNIGPITRSPPNLLYRIMTMILILMIMILRLEVNCTKCYGGEGQQR